MARIARVVVPGLPHHVTQRGVRRQITFFNESDYESYLELMAEWCARCGVSIWSYCLMPNHVHLIATPDEADGLRRGIGEAHRRYTRRINFREGWRGYLWQGRFASFPLDERHLLAAARYVELNPVRAGLVARPEDYRWSSAAAHLSGRDDLLVRTRPLLEMVSDWRAFLQSALSDEELADLRRHEHTGRPLGDERFIESIERKIDRLLRRKKPGPKPKIERR
ncbi:MAG: transposase [Myxococcales bacterium]|nr:transposase [Myxococcales bacterium]